MQFRAVRSADRKPYTPGPAGAYHSVLKLDKAKTCCHSWATGRFASCMGTRSRPLQFGRYGLWPVVILHRNTKFCCPTKRSHILAGSPGAHAAEGDHKNEIGSKRVPRADQCLESSSNFLLPAPWFSLCCTFCRLRQPPRSWRG